MDSFLWIHHEYKQFLYRLSDSRTTRSRSNRPESFLNQPVQQPSQSGLCLTVETHPWDVCNSHHVLTLLDPGRMVLVQCSGVAPSPCAVSVCLPHVETCSAGLVLLSSKINFNVNQLHSLALKQKYFLLCDSSCCCRQGARFTVWDPGLVWDWVWAFMVLMT